MSILWRGEIKAQVKSNPRDLNETEPPLDLHITLFYYLYMCPYVYMPEFSARPLLCWWCDRGLYTETVTNWNRDQFDWSIPLPVAVVC